MHLLNANAESAHAVEDLVGSLHPSERCAAVVVRVDVREDGGAQLRNARVRSTLERLFRQGKVEISAPAAARDANLGTNTRAACADAVVAIRTQPLLRQVLASFRFRRAD